MASLAYCQSIIDRGGGIIAMPQWLGVVVGPDEAEANVPAGWMFVPVAGLVAERLVELVDEFRNSCLKKDWPKRDDNISWDLPTKVIGNNGGTIWKRGDKGPPPKPGDLARLLVELMKT